MGNVRYTPDKRGLRELGQSPGVRDAALEAAARVANWARQDDPRGAYEVTPANVTAGWDNEIRAGASVMEMQRGAGGRKRTLARAAREAR